VLPYVTIALYQYEVLNLLAE